MSYFDKATFDDDDNDDDNNDDDDDNDDDDNNDNDDDNDSNDDDDNGLKPDAASLSFPTLIKAAHPSTLPMVELHLATYYFLGRLA